MRQGDDIMRRLDEGRRIRWRWNIAAAMAYMRRGFASTRTVRDSRGYQLQYVIMEKGYIE